MKPFKKMQKKLERRQNAMAATIKAAKNPAQYRMPGSWKKS